MDGDLVTIGVHAKGRKGIDGEFQKDEESDCIQGRVVE